MHIKMYLDKRTRAHLRSSSHIDIFNTEKELELEKEQN